MKPIIDTVQTGKNIKKLMLEKNLGAREIQDYLELSCPQTVYRWLRGVAIPNVDNLYALSELFGVPMDEIIKGNRQNSYPPFIVKEPITYYKPLNV